MKFFTVLAVVASLAATLDARNINPLVDGGREATQHEFPFVAGIWTKDGPDPKVLKCAGIIVSNKVVITSAKCVHKADKTQYPIADIIVIAGDHDITADDNDDEEVAEVASVVVRKEWDAEKNQNDIVAITLKEELDLTKPGIALATIPSTDEDVAEDKDGNAVGWGEVGEPPVDPPENKAAATKLQVAGLTIAKKADCETKYEAELVSEANFCAGSATGVLCTGDEGSPFIVDGEDNAKIVVGFASNIKDCVKTDAGALFTKLAPHYDWIQEQIDPTITTTEKEEIPDPSTTEKDGENPDPSTTENDGENPDPSTTEKDGENPDPSTTEKDGENPDPSTTEKNGENPDPSTTEGKATTDSGIMVKNNFWLLVLAIPLLVLQQ